MLIVYLLKCVTALGQFPAFSIVFTILFFSIHFEVILFLET